MAKKEDDKLDIEDIKDPLEEAEQTDNVDLEEVVAEETQEEEPAETEEKEDAPAENNEGEPDELEKAQAEAPAEEEEAKKEDKPEKIKKPKKPFPWKTVAIVVITFLVTAALVLGGIYYFQKKNAPKEEPVTENTANVEVNVVKPATTQKTVYVTAEGGLNLRQEPATTAAILAVIPYGTKLDVLTTQATWYKTTYSGQTGWIDSTYTATENPLVYKDATYKFQITFPSDWAGYKLFPITGDSSQTAAWYVGLPTTDTAYIPSGVDKGYANMFALSVYTPAQWTAVQAGEGAAKPTLAVQNQQWVIAYSLPNGTMAKDLTKQAAETKDVVKTIKFY